jgi:hypothetical protein
MPGMATPERTGLAGKGKRFFGRRDIFSVIFRLQKTHRSIWAIAIF